MTTVTPAKSARETFFERLGTHDFTDEEISRFLDDFTDERLADYLQMETDLLIHDLDMASISSDFHCYEDFNDWAKQEYANGLSMAIVEKLFQNSKIVIASPVQGREPLTKTIVRN